MAWGRQTHARIFAVWATLLIVAHVWAPTAEVDPREGSTGLYGGWMPWDLAYPLVWMAVAGLAVVHLTRFVWPEDR